MIQLHEEIERLTKQIGELQEKLTADGSEAVLHGDHRAMFRLKGAIDDMRLTIWCLLQKNDGKDPRDLLESLKMHRIVEMLRSVRQGGRACSAADYAELQSIDRISASSILRAPKQVQRLS